MGKLGHVKKFEHKKVKHLKKLENEILQFGAFQKIEKMLSLDKILFHMLFGAFHDTPCNVVGTPDGDFQVPSGRPLL